MADLTTSQKRIISAIVLIALVMVSILLGKLSSLVLIMLLGCLVVDEIYVNFFRKKRKNIGYFIAQLLFLLPFVYQNFLDSHPGIDQIFLNASLALNFILIYFLFNKRVGPSFGEIISSKFSFLAGIVILLPLGSMGLIIGYSMWIRLIAILLLSVYVTDTAAWFFGKNWGKRKLWPSVSPNKTIEGSVGGMVSSLIVSSSVWDFVIADLNWGMFVSFALLGIISQIGDLIQSKFKRLYQIKDSSSLIPGHGGVYDRVDSLIFAVPFYALALQLFYKPF